MLTPGALVPLVLLHAATLSTTTLPAKGKGEAILTLDAPGAVHLSARSASGTRCDLIDRVRGPFANSGQVGKTNCELDLLLDQGQYKVRVESPDKGKGSVTLSAQPFVELNASPVRLAPGTGVTTALKPGQQASFWLSVDARHVPFIRVAGRHAGDVRLWRGGEWLEPSTLRHTQFSPLPGQPLHEWWLDSVVEPGEYLLVVYGRDSTKVTGTSVDDSLTVESGFRDGPAQRSFSFVLPASGVTAVKVPSESMAGIVALEASPPAPVELQLYGVTGLSGLSSPNTCRVEKNAVVPECSTTFWSRSSGSSSTPAWTVILVRGPAGTRGTVEWATYRNETSTWRGFGGYYGGPTSRIAWGTATAGNYLVGLHDLPVDNDAAPLGCQIEKVDKDGNTTAVVARSGPRIGENEQLDRDFNYDGNGAVIWFEVAAPESTGAALLTKVGLSQKKYLVQTKGGLKERCEVFRLEGNGALNRLTETKPEAVTCNEKLALTPGWYQLQLYGGLSGVEHLTVKEDTTRALTAAANTAGCAFSNVAFGADDYRLVTTRVGAVNVRGFIFRPLPLDTAQPLHLTLNPGQKLTVPLAAGPAVDVRSSGAARFDCALAAVSVSTSPGACALPARSATDTLTVSNPGTAPVVLTVARPVAPPPVAPPLAFSPKLNPPPRIGTDIPTFFDFDRGEQHSATFQVDTPGLYNVTTQGLLATECRLRTPVVDEVARNQGGGRGRNCLVQTYLQKGRYMLTVQTVGSSRGRGAAFLTRRAPKEFPGVGGEGETFFRVDANELVQQKLVVKTPDVYSLGTTGQGQKFLCRLDDPEGWPLEPVPSDCEGQRTLGAGTWLWTQLPLTVESMRRTRLERVRQPVVLKGNKPHGIEAFTWYDAELGSDGKDEFLFTLEGETELDWVLTNGMQGRIFALEKDKAPRAVEIIPAQIAEAAPESGEYQEQPQESPPDESSYRGEMGEGEAGDYHPEGEGGEGEYQPPPQSPPPQQLQTRAAPPPPSGVRLTLPGGSYKLVTEHSRGDVAVAYRLHFGSATLLPGMTRTLPVPSTVPVLVPRDGTLRLRTVGEADVRCRLFDGSRLVFEGSENGADWNCALAEPVTKGRYTLVVESETQLAGETKVTLGLPASDAKGVVTDGAKLSLGQPVVTLSVPVAEKDAVQELAFTSKTPISCALEDPSGQVAWRRTRVTDCSMLVRPMTEAWKVRLWTTDGSAQVLTSFRSKALAAGEAGSLAGNASVAVTVPRAGRFKTAPQLWCLPAGQKGMLRLCGPETSLEAGPTVFAAFGTAATTFALDEVKAAAADAAAPLELGRQPFLQAVTAPAPSVFLLSASVRHGERAAPSCTFDGEGVAREGRATTCFAASRVGTEASTRLWAAADQGVDAQVLRRAVAVPAKTEALTPGRKRLTFPGGVGAFALPVGGRTRLELTVPRDGWAVLLDDKGRALDLCAPNGKLKQCVLTGQGGSVLLAVPDATAEVTTVALESAPQTTTFTGLYEDVPRLPGTVRLALPAAEQPRTVSVEGALRCTVSLATGERFEDCRAAVPAKVAAELTLEHGTQAVRAVAHVTGRDKWARLALELPVMPGPALAAATAVPLSSGRVDRTLVVTADALVRISADSGVCGLLKGNDLLAVDGLDQGCELVRILTPGTYRLLLRPFDGRAATGTVRWTAEPVSALGEGVGNEEWLAPGNARLFRFETKNKGKVGLGLQSKSEALECAVYNDGYQLVGDGCQQYLSLDKGGYLLMVRNPPKPGAAPLAFKPVLLGLKGDTSDIPEDFLKDFFRRAGVTP